MRYIATRKIDAIKMDGGWRFVGKMSSVSSGIERRRLCKAVVCAILDASPGWRNWQTRRTQNPVAARPCRFDSYARHYPISPHWFRFQSETEILMIAAIFLAFFAFDFLILLLPVVANKPEIVS
jgi:hypothetical protein